MGGANSPAGLASRPIKILLADEVDRFPDSAGTEGDPVDLAVKRMTTFWDRVMGLFSTPTISGESRIEEEYQEGTQEEWQHECPNCKEYHLLTHRQMFTDYETVTDKKAKSMLPLMLSNGAVLIADTVLPRNKCGGHRKNTLHKMLRHLIKVFGAFLLTAGRHHGLVGKLLCRNG